MATSRRRPKSVNCTWPTETFLERGRTSARWETPSRSPRRWKRSFRQIRIRPKRKNLLGSTIQLAFQEGVNPRKGFELILQHYGMCRAITMFSAYPQQDGRDESLRLLVRSLHGELVSNLKRAISAVEGKLPEGDSIPALIAGRDWLFENNAQHTDSSHIVALLKLSGELEDQEC